MTIRTDFTIDYEVSPRIITIATPSVEVTLQDLHDTLTTAEDDIISEGATHPNLILSSGKEDLGGGTLVGITSELQDCQLTFQDRTTIFDTAAVTTPDATGVSLVDSASTFESDLVTAGMLLMNTTDNSHATILEVVSETELRTQPLGGGSDNQYDTSDGINIFKIWQCKVTGGNLVAVDSLGAELSSVFQSFGTQIVVSSSSSATLQELTDIQHSSFDGSVHVNVETGVAGTDYPTGNTENPVDNLTDAAAINVVRGFNQYSIEKSTTITNVASWVDATFIGKSIIDTVIDVDAGVSLDKAEFFNCSLEGTLGDTTIMQRCFLGETNPLLDVQGVIEDCSIGPSPLTLGGANTTTVRLVRCNGAGEDTSPPTLNGNGDGPKLDIQDYSGALKLINKTGAAFWDLHLDGELTIDSTCTNGVIRVLGAGNLTDSSGAGCTIIDQMLKPEQVSEMWKLQGLERGNPMTVTTADRTVADQSISLALTGDGTTTQTVTRQTDQTVTLDIPLTADLLDDSDTAATPTFARASTGTYLNSSTGFVTTALANAARFELGGLLIEEARTNICLQSEDFTTTWVTDTESLVDANATTAPDGTTTADRHKDDNGGGTGTASISQGITTATSTAYVYSMYFKADQNDWAYLAVQGFTGLAISAFFDLTNGVVGATTGADNTSEFIKDVGNGWFRCGIGFTSHASETVGNLLFYIATANANNTTTLSDDSSIFGWGSQLELGDTPTSYIPTITIAVTRSADFLSYNDDTAIVDALGSAIATITPNGTAVRNSVIANVSDQLVGPMYLLDNTTQDAASGDGTTVNAVAMTLVDNTESKVAARWSTADNELQVIADGTAATASAYDNVFTRTAGTLYICSDSTGNHINGNIKSVKIYNVDRGTAQLQVDTG